MPVPRTGQDATTAAGGADMPLEADNGPRPGRDVMVGLFFLAWASAGWVSAATSTQLFSDIYAGLDPGPALMPVIVLSVLSLGGAAILLTGLVGLLRPGRRRGAAVTPGIAGRLRPHLIPAGLLATMIVYPTIMHAVGYVPATAVFVLGWISALTDWRRWAGARRRLLAAAIAVFATAVVVAILYGGFVVVIHAPLP